MSKEITLTDADAQADLAGTPRPDNPTIQPHQYRMLNERDNLADNTAKLEAFTGGDMFRSLDTHEQARQVRQLNHMRGYLQALNDRIAAF